MTAAAAASIPTTASPGKITGSAEVPNADRKRVTVSAYSARKAGSVWCSTGWASAAWVAWVLPTGPVASVNTGPTSAVLMSNSPRQ